MEFVAKWTAAGCSQLTQLQCVVDQKCMWLVGRCQYAECSLSLGWERVLDLTKQGRAFSGGMGKKAVHNAYMDMKTWVCVRDWDAAAQVRCGVGSREFACFGYEERSNTFMPIGMDSERNLLRESGTQPDADSLALLWPHDNGVEVISP